jgi:hypothetical protein
MRRTSAHVPASLGSAALINAGPLLRGQTRSSPAVECPKPPLRFPRQAPESHPSAIGQHQKA